MFKLGLIIPSSNTTMEPEFYRMLPNDFTVHTARLRLKKVTVKDLAKMEKDIDKEAIKLADAGVDVIGYGCTSGSLFRGLGHDRMIEEKIEKVSGKPAVATSGAVVNALEKEFLEANGFKVVDLKGLGLSDNMLIGRIDEQTAIKLVTSLKHENADGVFISCTNFPTIRIIQKLEDMLKKPVISSNTATLWLMLRKLAISTKIKGYGKLLEL